jgi:hypothetical protein
MLPPPPKTDDPKEIIAYFEVVDKPGPRAVRQSDDPPDALLGDCVHYVTARWNRLPNRTRVRDRFMTDLIGMLLGNFGLVKAQSFSPIPVPEALKPKPVGRPRLAKPAKPIGRPKLAKPAKKRA